MKSSKVLRITASLLIVALLSALVFYPRSQKETRVLSKKGLDYPKNNFIYKYKLTPVPLNSRIVYLYGEVNGENGPDVAAKILELGDSDQPMTIFINSPGGSIIVGSQIISAIEAARGPVNTVCIQFCASMAAMIHQYGTTRYMINKSILLFHPASGGVNASEMDKMYSELSFFKRFIGKMEENAADRAHISLKDYKFESATELILDSEDAYSRRFTDQVGYIRGSDTKKIFHAESPQESADKKKFKINTSITIDEGDIMWE